MKTCQQAILRRVETLFALADALEARLVKAGGQADKLKSAPAQATQSNQK